MARFMNGMAGAILLGAAACGRDSTSPEGCPEPTRVALGADSRPDLLSVPLCEAPETQRN